MAVNIVGGRSAALAPKHRRARLAVGAPNSSAGWSLRWLYRAVPIVALFALLAWAIQSSLRLDDQSVTIVQTAMTDQDMPTVRPVMIAGADIGHDLVDNLASLDTVLAHAIDARSARRALSQLEAIDARLQEISDMQERFSADQQSAISSIVRPRMARLSGILNTVFVDPTVATILMPAVHLIVSKLWTLETRSPQGQTAAP